MLASGWVPEGPGVLVLLCMDDFGEAELGTEELSGLSPAAPLVACPQLPAQRCLPQFRSC